MTEHLEKMKKIESHWNPTDPGFCILYLSNPDVAEGF